MGTACATLTDASGGRIVPWEEDGIIIVSRHLIARADRRAGLLAVQRPWDAVLVDEAHAARRRVFGDGPNQLLGLLQTLRALSLFRCLWLLTATPMQLDPHEVHDLLLLCGFDDQAWGAGPTSPPFKDSSRGCGTSLGRGRSVLMSSP